MRAASFFVLGLVFGTVLVRAQPAVTLEAVTDRKFYRENATSEVYVEARVAVARSAAVAPPSKRNIALVLDRSGSMAGESIAALRDATRAAIDGLAAEDFISVVLFGSEVETLIPAQNRDQIRDLGSRVDQIEPAGGAALYDALNQGAAQLRRHMSPASLNHLILVTDGPPTKGPREFDDFSRLAEVFAGEGMIVSTLGLGPDFNEDTLAAMARIGGGRFRYVARSSRLADALRAELQAPPGVIGHDAVLTIEFRPGSRKIQSHGWRPPGIDDRTLTYRFPRLLADQPVTVLASAELDSFAARFEVPDFALVRLRWKGVDDGEPHELVRPVVVQLTTDSRDLRDSLDPGVARTGADVAIREGLQKAIEQLDKGSPRAALRALRTARSEARDLNFNLEDVQIDGQIRRLDAYLADAQARGMGPSDRKLLRSGLNNQFDPPAPAVEPRN